MSSKRKGVKVGGRARFQIWSVPDADGRRHLEYASKWSKNLLPTAFLRYIQQVTYTGAAQVTTWYMALIDNSPSPTLAMGDTMGSHAGWAENTDYDEATRPAWDEVEASAVVTNNTLTEFTINDTVTIRGAFLTSVDTKGGTTGTLGPEFLFDEGAQALTAGKLLRIEYENTAQNA